MRRVGCVLVVVGLVFGIAGCGGSGSASTAPSTGPGGSAASGSAGSSFAIPTVPVLGSSVPNPGGNDGSGITVDVPTGSGAAPFGAPWPAGSPTDIPPFPGQMEPNWFSPSASSLGYYMRFFFDGVTRDATLAYLGQLKANGFTLKGIVLYSESQGEQDAQARAARGDIDEVVATKGSLKLTVGIPAAGPGATVSFDVDGLTLAQANAMRSLSTFSPPTPRPESFAPWPSDWTSKLPQPDGCTVAGGAGPSSPSQMMASCRYPDTDQAHQEQIAAQYKAKLLAAGFVAKSTGGNGIPEIPGSFMVTKGTIEVTVMIHAGTDSMMITAMDRS